MRILLALAGLALVVVLGILLWRPAPPPAPPARNQAPEPPATETQPAPGTPPSAAAPQLRPAPSPLAAPPSRVSPMPGALLGEPPAMPGPVDAAALHAQQQQELDYAYWDMKLGMLRKISQCVGDKLQTQGAAEVDYHFKRQGNTWLADHAEVRDPNDVERQKMGAVDWRGADRELAQKCISEAFAGVTMPMTGGSDQVQGDYTVNGQIMFPTANDRAWKETGVSPQ
jgi:hypothetical protein